MSFAAFLKRSALRKTAIASAFVDGIEPTSGASPSVAITVVAAPAGAMREANKPTVMRATGGSPAILAFMMTVFPIFVVLTLSED
jgi:hypothetical protein